MSQPVGKLLPGKTVGGLFVAWHPASGLSLSSEGVQLVRQATLYVVKPGWTGLLFDQRSADWQSTHWHRDGDAEVAELVASSESVRCHYRLTLRTPGTLTVALTVTLLREIPTELEYAAAYLSANLLAGAMVSGDTRLTSIPTRPLTGSQEARRVGPPWQQLTFTTALGKLGLRYDGTLPRPICFDARADSQGWATAYPVFWTGIGSPTAPLRYADGPQTATITFTWEPGRRPKPDLPLTLELTAQPRTDIRVPLPPETPRVIPQPKQLAVTGKPLRLTPATRVTLAGPGTDRALPLLRAGLQARLGWMPALTVGKGSAPKRPEGYRVTVTPAGATLSGADVAGTLWAVQTFLQLIQRDKDGWRLPQVAIDDWPTLALRGVHLFHGKTALAFHQKLIARVLSPFKLNTLLIQCEQLRWESAPELAPPWAGSKADIVAERAFAQAHGLTLYPLLQGYGHLEWFFANGRHRDFAEDPATPYALRMDDPTARAALTKIVAEADTLFNAPAFHMGLDEVTMRGRLPFRSRGKRVGELFLANVQHWHGVLARRRKPLWMWADMVLHPSEAQPGFGDAPSLAEAQQIRAGLPRDTVLFDWQYSARDRYPSLALLRREGFSVVASTWNTDGIQPFARAAAAAGALGGLQTTWCGYESKEAVLAGSERWQFIAMVVAAEHFWNGGANPLPYDPAEVFARAYADPDPRAGRVRSGWVLPLGKPAQPLAVTGWPVGTARLNDGALYSLSDGAWLLAGRLLPQKLPRTLTLIVPPGAEEVRLILAASHRVAPGERLGILVRGDQRLPLVYGQTIAAIDDPTPLSDARVSTVWRRDGLTLRALTLRGKGSVRIESDFVEAAPAVLGIAVLG